MLVNLLTRVQVRHLLCVSKTHTQRRQLSIHLALSLALPHLLLIQFFQFIIFKLSMHKEGEEACAFRILREGFEMKFLIQLLLVCLLFQLKR